MVHRGTSATQSSCSNWVTWPYFEGHRGHLRQRHMQDGFRSISEERFDLSSPDMVHRSTGSSWRPSLNWVTLTSFSRSPRSLRRQHMKDGFRSLSETIFDVSSPNLLHRSTRARQRHSLNWWPWPRFQGHRSHLRLRHEIWFLLCISRNIWPILTKFCAQKNYWTKSH